MDAIVMLIKTTAERAKKNSKNKNEKDDVLKLVMRSSSLAPANVIILNANK